MPVYSTVIGNSAKAMRRILMLHKISTNELVVDLTYRNGTFWKETNTNHCQLIRCDLFPQKRFDIQCDMQHTPFRDGVFSCVVIDPPFANSSTTPRTDGISRQYNLESVMTPKKLKRLYRRSIKEAWRILKRKGILIVKCQPFIDSGKQNWIDHDVLRWAQRNGFYAKDRFWLIPRTKPRMRHKTRQLHARKWGSVFWVFEKSFKLPSNKVVSTSPVSERRQNQRIVAVVRY